MSSSSSSSSRTPASVRARQTRIAKDYLAKFYNPVAGRPYPPITGLQDMITVQLTKFTSAYFTTSTTVNVYAGLAFTIAAFDSYAEYTGLFDQYRFDRIEIWLEPTNPAYAGVSYGELVTAVDLDDANTPTAIANVADRPGALNGQGSSGRYLSWRPHVALAAYSGAFTSYANSVRTWIDSGSTGVEHYGLKIASSPTGTATVSYNLTVRATVSFRAPGI